MLGLGGEREGPVSVAPGVGGRYGEGTCDGSQEPADPLRPPATACACVRRGIRVRVAACISSGEGPWLSSGSENGPVTTPLCPQRLRITALPSRTSPSRSLCGGVLPAPCCPTLHSPRQAQASSEKSQVSPRLTPSRTLPSSPLLVALRSSPSPVGGKTPDPLFLSVSPPFALHSPVQPQTSPLGASSWGTHCPGYLALRGFPGQARANLDSWSP